MSLEAAGLLLDLAGIPGDGPTSPRLASAVEVLDSLDPDARAAVALARVCAAGPFDGVSAARATELVEFMAADLGVTIAVDPGHRFAEDLDGTMTELLDDLEARLSRLPFGARSDLRRRIAEHDKLRRTKVPFVPSGLLAEFVAALEAVEAEHVENRGTAPGPTSGTDAAPGPAGAGSGTSTPEAAA